MQGRPASAAIGAGGINSETTSAENRNKPNVLTKRKAGSIGSNRQALGAQDAGVGKSAQSSSLGTRTQPPQAAQQKKKKGGIGAFLAKLCSCGSSSAADGDEQPEPVRMANLNTAQTNQQMSQNKPSESQTESGTADSKEEDLGVNAVPHEGTLGTEKRIIAPTQIDLPTHETRLPSSSGSEVAGKSLPEKPLPASPPIIPGPSQYRPAAPIHSKSVIYEYDTPHTAPQVTLSTPSPTVSQTMVFPEEEQEISDRTPQQQQLDEDIEMTDATPSVPLASHEIPTLPEQSSTTHRETATKPQVGIPPPPSEDERQLQVASRVNQSHQSAEPPRKWLLPPLRPEFRGRKCLVLDLDETLVHSSFKV